jgi:hypothetical protein
VKATTWFRLALDFLLVSFVSLLALECISTRAAAQNCNPSSWTGNFYQYEIVACTNESVQVGNIQGNLTGFGVAPSINENGTVAFDGQVSGSSGLLGDTLFMGAAGSTDLTAVSLVLDLNTTFDDAVQINDTNQIVATREVQGPSYHLDVYNGNNPGQFTDVADSGGKYQAILTDPSINSSNTVVFSAFDKSFNLLLGASPSLNNLALKPAQPPIRPMISDSDSIVVRDGNTNTSPIMLYSYLHGKFTQLVIADTSEFSLLGESPGISRDGRVVVFAGDLTSVGRWDSYAGPGIFAAILKYSAKTGLPTVQYTTRVAGFHLVIDYGKKIQQECVLDTQGNCVSPYYFDEGEPWCDPPCANYDAGGELEDLYIRPYNKGPKAVYFQTFTESVFQNSTEWENRIAVTHSHFSTRNTVDGDTIVVSFIATPSQDDSSGWGLFSANSGIWTVRVDLFLDSNSAPFYHVYRPVKVVQIGDTLGSTGPTVTGVGVYDPLARTTPVQNGGVEAHGDHRLGFWVCTQPGGCSGNGTTSQMILRATYIQQYGVSGSNVKDCHKATGTLGSLFTASQSSQPVILTNDHVIGIPQTSNSNGAVPGQSIVEPGYYDFNSEAAHEVGQFLGAPTLDSGVDAAIATLDTGQINTTGQIYIAGIPANSIAQPMPKMLVACRRVTITRLLASKLSWLLAAKSCSPSNSSPI